MMKIKVIIPITSISVNTIQHHRLAAARARRGSDSPPDCHSIPRRRYATSREGKKKFHLPAKGSNRHRFGDLRIS